MLGREADRHEKSKNMLALSPHAALAERLEDLRECGDVNVARMVCEDDTNPPALRQLALEMLDGLNLNQDLSLALACSVETCGFREDAIQIANRFVPAAQHTFAAEYLQWLTYEIKTNPNKYLLLAIWGVSSVANIKLDVSHVEPNILLNLIDLLAGIAGEEFLQVSNKRELMGSWNVKALGALGLISLGTKLTDPVWFKSALHRYLDFTKLRSLAVVCLMRENTKVSVDVKALLVCESIEQVILQDSTLKTWNQLWFWKTDPLQDEHAGKLVDYSHHFAKCTVPLLHWLQHMLHMLDEAVQLKIILLASSFAQAQINLPWKTPQLCEIASGIITNQREKNIVWDLEEMRNRLGKERWKEDWIGTPALLYMCMQEANVEFVCTRGDLESHLLACLLPLVDDVDPRVSAPAWHVLTRCLKMKRFILFPKHQPLLLHTLERNLATRDETVFVQVCAFYQVCFESYNNAATMERKLVENLASDAFYSAHSNAKLYNLSITLVLCGAVQRLNVACIPLLDLLLRAAEAGAQQRGTNSAALLLLNSILAACEPRVRAHRGRILALFLRLAVLNASSSQLLQQGFASFVRAVRHDDDDWVLTQMDKVSRVNPDLADKLKL